MSSGGLAPEVLAFLDAHIFSVTQLEVLLLTREADGDGVTAGDLSRTTRVPERSLTPWLDVFVDRGLLVRDENGLYGPATLGDELQRTVGAVSEAFTRRRVTLSRHVYGSRQDPAQRFADAFRFRRDKDTS